MHFVRQSTRSRFGTPSLPVVMENSDIRFDYAGVIIKKKNKILTVLDLDRENSLADFAKFVFSLLFFICSPGLKNLMIVTESLTRGTKFVFNTSQVSCEVRAPTSHRFRLPYATFTAPAHPPRSLGFETLRGAWRDRDTNNIFAHCSLIFYFLDFKFSNFVCPSVLHRLIWFFLKSSFRKKKNIRKTTQNALAPGIFIVLSIALKLGTPLLHTQAQNKLLQNFYFRSTSRDMDEKPPKTLFYPTRSALTKHNFFRRSKLKNLWQRILALA